MGGAPRPGIMYSKLPNDATTGRQILAQRSVVILDVASTGDDFVALKVRT